MKNAVIVKSFRNGLTLYLDSDLDFGQLLEEVAGKFKESKEFFSDASVAVSFEGRELSFEEEDSLIETIRINSHLNITCIVGKDEEKNRIYGKALEEFRRKRYEEESAGQFYRGTLRRGQILETESSIIVLGDVNPGSSVIAAGDIVVLGSPRVFKALRNQLAGVLVELQRIETGSCIDDELLDVIEMIAVILGGLKGEEQNE